MGDHPLLHSHRVIQPVATINRLQILLHSSAVLVSLSYHAFSLLRLHPLSLSTLSLSLLLSADLLLFFLWILAQAFRFRPVSRSVFPDRLPDDSLLPAIDVFIVTADPEKEPPVEVMNTVLSVMAMDYPVEKLHVYLSDDAGSDLMLYAARKAFSFARFWLPFCKRNRIEVRCPRIYFSSSAIHGGKGKDQAEFVEEWERMKNMYESFKEGINEFKEKSNHAKGLTNTYQDHPPKIEIIRDNEESMPLLVYVSREKRPNCPHHFKAGALNALLRVSSIISNSPYILVLDCDMYSAEPNSVRQALCFHLDPNLSPFLAFVQFPQIFRNLSKNDIYCGELRSIFQIEWLGCDGLRGPILSGTNFYIKRYALYGTIPGQKSTREEFNSMEISELRRKFGASNEFILSLIQNGINESENGEKTMKNPDQEYLLVTNCDYENETQWGEQIGFLYGSVVEDYYTGLHLHCKGWISTYFLPSKPAFYGNAPINFNITLVQNKRWMTGMLGVGLSKNSPLIFGIFSKFSKISVLESMCYAWHGLRSLGAIGVLLYGTIPQLSFLNGISIFPEVSSPYFAAFALVFLSSLLQHLREVYLSKRDLTTWCNEQRFWMINGLTGQLFACVTVFLNLIGVRSTINFDLTNKSADEAQIKRYEKGVFDFEGCSMLLLPATTLSILNLISLIIGGYRMVKYNRFNELFGQFFLLCFIFVMSFPVIAGILLRRDTGRVPPRVVLWSIVLSSLMLYLFW